MAPSLTDLIASYAILPALASGMTTVDLYHLAATNRSHFAHILGSPRIFKALSAQCLCDGAGNHRRRQAANEGDRDFILPCSEGEASPCCKCGVNICEECREYPRVPFVLEDRYRKPGRDASHEVVKIICLCPECDTKVEEEVAGKFSSGVCDCDLIERWICTVCEHKENQAWHEYRDNNIQKQPYWYWSGERLTKIIYQAVGDVALWCPCKAPVPQDTLPRCLCCRRRHSRADGW